MNPATTLISGFDDAVNALSLPNLQAFLNRYRDGDSWLSAETAARLGEAYQRRQRKV